MRKVPIESLLGRKDSITVTDRDASRSKGRDLGLRTQREGSRTLRVINTTGNVKQNTAELLKQLKCSCNCKKEVEVIVMAFAEKIQKIRQERNKFKGRNKQLKEINELLQLELAKREQPCKGDNESRLQLRVRYLEQQLKLQRQINQRAKSQLDHSSSFNQFSKCQKGEVTEENQFLRAANLSLQKKIKQLEDQLSAAETKLKDGLKQQRPASLKTKQQIQMWELANRLGEQAWQRKLELQIKQLCERKEQLRKQERGLQDRQKKRNISIANSPSRD